MKKPLTARLFSAPAFAVTASVVLLSGCGTIFNGGSGPVTIRSNAPNATYTIVDRKGNQVASGRSSQQFTLQNSSGYMIPGIYTVRATAPGYEDTEHRFRAVLSGWYAGNILFGGALGMLILDPLSGGMWEVEQEVTIPMRKLTGDKIAATVAAENPMAAAATTSTVWGRHQYNAEQAAAARNCTNTTLVSSGPGVELYTAQCGEQPVSVKCEFSNCAVQ